MSNGKASIPKISFCTTCKQRLWQLRHTFRPNLEAILTDGFSEIVLLNYNSQDGLDDWIRQFRPEIEAGLLRYIHERTETHFHCSKAKNLAHFASTGDFVVNLDADNYIGDTIPAFRNAWRNHYDTVIHGFCGDYSDGTYGRIGLSKRYFLALGGYDEEMLSFGHQDRDLIRRAEAFGLRRLLLKQDGIPALKNDYRDKMKFSGSTYSYGEMATINSARSDESICSGRLAANPDRTPVKVLLNFSVETEL
jgi:predicted glycosyltransferase involved in capsule biosynthesis